MNDIVIPLLTHRNQIKMFHWRTSLYSRHKATDDYLGNFDKLIDKITECLIGSRSTLPKDNFSMDIISLDDNNVGNYLTAFKRWIHNDFTPKISKHETNIATLKDELLVELDNLIYLFTLQ